VTDWQSLSPAELEREYSPSSAIGGNYQPFIEQYVQRSAAARAWFAAQTQATASYDIAYGEQARQRLDLFLPSAPAKPPLVVFIHGGYWQELSKNESHFAAIDAVQAGLAHAVIGYTLAPAASVADIVAECVQALKHLHANATSLGFDADRIVVAGSSAGAHLAAMVALQCPFVRGTVLVSGIYELEPLIHTTINQALGLNAESARACSPQRQDLSTFPAIVVAYGAVETAQFKQQSQAFAQQIGCKQLLEIPQRNHFDVVLDVLNPATVLGEHCLGFIQQLN
jgi:arylformamidase